MKKLFNKYILSLLFLAFGFNVCSLRADSNASLDLSSQEASDFFDKEGFSAKDKEVFYKILSSIDLEDSDTLASLKEKLKPAMRFLRAKMPSVCLGASIGLLFNAILLGHGCRGEAFDLKCLPLIKDLGGYECKVAGQSITQAVMNFSTKHWLSLGSIVSLLGYGDSRKLLFKAANKSSSVFGIIKKNPYFIGGLAAGLYSLAYILHEYPNVTLKCLISGSCACPVTVG